jgi:phosphoribosylglycinamide formyltransferase-1
MKRLVIFASGNGSNFEAIISAIENKILDAQIVGLICDKSEAYCLTRAKNHGVPAAVFHRSDYDSKLEMDCAILRQVKEWEADWLVLAGYMRLLTSLIIQAYPKRIINIHPSLLPKYKGKDALGQALANHETTLGVSVHYVDEGMDTGALIAQESFTIQPDQDRGTIEQTLHQLEHTLYPKVLQKLIKENP